MKTRFLIAAVFAITIHAFFFINNFNFLSQDANIFPATNVMQMTLVSPKQKSAESQTKKQDIKTVKITNKNNLIENQSDKEKLDTANSDHLESISVIHKAKPLNLANKPPAYPRIARLRGYQGTVVLKVLVNQKGTVSELKILQTSGYWILDKSAITAVKDWVFEPGTDGSRNMDMWIEQPIRFQLQ
jgi:TonB family protein